MAHYSISIECDGCRRLHSTGVLLELEPGPGCAFAVSDEPSVCSALPVLQPLIHAPVWCATGKDYVRQLDDEKIYLVPTTN